MKEFRLPGKGGESASEALEAVLRDVRSAFRSQPDYQGDVGALLELYGSITSLCARSQRIRAVLATRSDTSQSGTTTGVDADELALSNLQPDEVRQFDGFYRELLDFGRCMTAVNLAAIDIYFPGLRQDLLNVTGRDLDFSSAYLKLIAPKYGLADRELPSTLVQVLDRYSGDWGAENVGGQLILEFDWNAGSNHRDSQFSEYHDIPTRVSITSIFRITELLEACRAAIRGIVQENWDFRDLLDRRSTYGGGIVVANTEYNISGSQVGAVGGSAHVHDVTFHQQVVSIAGDIDVVLLAEQLERLQAEMAKQASECDHYAALVAVSDAAADAREGRTAAAIAKLAVVGRWAVDIASKIGVSVATEAIKRATGLG